MTQRGLRQSKLRRWTRWGMYLAAAYVLLSYAGAWCTVHPITLPVRLTRQLAKHSPADVSFASADGTPLSGWWFQTPQAVGTIVLCHGAFENRMAMADCVPRLLEEHLNVLAFDFRARGRSGGSQSTLGKLEAEDVLGAVRWIRDRPEAADLPVGAMGFSQGAAAVLMAAARSREIDAVVADSGYASLDRAIDRHLRFFFGPFRGNLGLLVEAFGRRMVDFRPESVRPVDVIGEIAPRPILLIHGTRDWMIAPDNSVDLHRAAGEHCSLWLAPKARHTKARKRAPREYWSRVLAFWRESFASDRG